MNTDPAEDGSEEPTPQEQTAAFVSDVEAFAGGPSQLALSMQKAGDPRRLETITRGIQRMMAGTTGVSGEMRTILNLMRQQRLRAGRLVAEAVWTENPDQSISAKVSDFDITLYPATKGRWRSNLVHKGGYSPSWPRWEQSVEAAKEAAIQRLLEAEVELDEIWAYQSEAEAGG